MRIETFNGRKHITSFQVIIIGFFITILTGALLLTLPIATRDGMGASFADGLFTATSATCVTGLVVQDTATYWSVFGQCVILTLIQIGGMGVVTVAIALTTISGRKIGLMQRSVMQTAISAPQVGGIVKMTTFILKSMFLIELIGALLLSTVFIKDLGVGKGIWYSVFHSISAFCNAGFDLFGINEKFSSLTAYATNPVINFTIMGLIITGGIGFFTWRDIRVYGKHFHKYHMQSKVIIYMTAMLIAIPAAYFFFFDMNELGVVEKFWAGLFQSVTARTAGFNTIDLNILTDTGLMIMIILMITGGAPGSTAGGIKNTTLAVLISSAFAVFKDRDNAHFFGRRIPDSTIKDAATILLIYLTAFIGGAMLISSIEKLPMLTCLFETASAIGTVGLTLGITTTLSMASKLVLITLMFLGRVGGLTIVFAAVSVQHHTGAKYPEEKITVG